jgi:pepsin A
MYAPDELVSEFYAQIPGAKPAAEFGDGYYSYPCDTPLSISFTFQGSVKEFAIDSGDFNMGMADSQEHICLGGLIGMGPELPSNLAIFGTT